MEHNSILITSKGENIAEVELLLNDNMKPIFSNTLDFQLEMIRGCLGVQANGQTKYVFEASGEKLEMLRKFAVMAATNFNNDLLN